MRTRFEADAGSENGDEVLPGRLLTAVAKVSREADMHGEGERFADRRPRKLA